MRTAATVFRRSVLLLLLLGAWSGRADGQITAGIATMAEILTLPLTATGTRALEFGVIVPGTTTVTVLPRTASGARSCSFRCSARRFR